MGDTLSGQPPTFNGNIANLYEVVGEEREVSKAGFSPEGGKSQRTWQITPANNTDLINSLTAILGTCNYTASGTGKLNRTLPQADPLYAWMYASSIPTIEGYGQYTKVSADPQLEAPGFPSGALWDQYNLSVESLPRPFPVLPDSAINTYVDTYYPETGGGTTNVLYTVAQEQNRYCSWDMQPQADYVTQQKGRMTFNSSDVANNASLNAMPRWYLPNSLYTVTWFLVPIRLVISSDSYITRWRGRINQNEMYGPDSFKFNKGELLYLNYSVKLFTPPVQKLVPLGGTGGDIVSTEKFCNLTLTFLYTTRTLISEPSVAPTNKNFVVGGHNLLPWNDGGFRYAQTVSTDPASPLPNQPAFLSAPLETLWTDCDSPQSA
ncbi:hypothetical protein [Frigoriglobus tundricola]|uniref:hypothetical protein n=1 Tax=Frigoriglobus tundricola TaxID=2774151 RepID=UPI00148EEC0B|nr:hypothetical protein [Frigoriglobus tundricola]